MRWLAKCPQKASRWQSKKQYASSLWLSPFLIYSLCPKPIPITPWCLSIVVWNLQQNVSIKSAPVPEMFKCFLLLLKYGQIQQMTPNSFLSPMWRESRRYILAGTSLLSRGSVTVKYTSHNRNSTVCACVSGRGSDCVSKSTPHYWLPLQPQSNSMVPC